MKLTISLITLFATLLHGQATGAAPAGGAEAFVRLVVQTLINGENKITFHVADQVFTLDNGEVLTKSEMQQAWPRLAGKAFKKKVSLEQFFREVELRISSPLDNKRLMSNKRVLEFYKPLEGDLYCDASHVKEGVENFIAYDKASLFIIRKVEDQWTLLGIGG